MSITRGSLQELCDIIESKPDVVLGKKFFDTRLVVHIEQSTKAEKYENRFLVISKFRLFLLTGKNANSLKIDRTFHILQIRSIVVLGENEAALMVEEGGSRKRLLIKGYPSEQLALAVVKTLRHYFSDISPLLPRILELKPVDLYKKAESLVMDVSPRPCHSFRRTYAALCDLYDQPYRDEVAWDVEKIYTANRINDLRLEDFSHLQPKDLVSIVSVLQYSSYFCGLVVDGLRLSAEMVDVIMGVVKHSLSLRRLCLSNCGLTREFSGLLAASLTDNERIPLETIDLSRNSTLDDRKGIAALSSCLTKLPSLRSLNLSDCNLSEKSSQQICHALYALASSGDANGGQRGIVHLNLANNIMKDDISSLMNLISIGTSLRSLNLADVHLPLDKLWQALKFGCLQLESLSVSGLPVGGKKVSTESTAAAKDFFATSVALKRIDISRVQMSGDLLKAVLTGLAINNQVEPFTLILDGSCERLGAILEEGLSGVRAAELSLRDCHLEADMAGVIQSIGRMPVLSSLSIGGANVVGLKKSAKTCNLINKAVNELVKLITTSTTLRVLSLAEAHLGSYVSLLINSLGACTSIRSLDLSANDLGNFGMRILSKALELNTSLRDLSLDNNHIGSDGLADLAFALEENLSLLSLPCPFNDIAEALLKERENKTKIGSTWSRIECSLERNRRGEMVYEIARKKSGYSPAHTPETPLDAPPIKEIIEEFVDKIRAKGGVWVREAVHGASTNGFRIENREATNEKDTIAKLNVAVERDVYTCLSQWLYQEMVSAKTNHPRSNHARSCIEKSHGDSPSHRSGTPQSDCASPSPAYRPRSIIADLKSSDSVLDAFEEVASAQPAGGKLEHITKSRPKPLRKRMIQNNLVAPPPLATIEDDRTSSPTDSIGSSLENRGTDCSSSPLSSRIVLLPPIDLGGGGGSVGGGGSSCSPSAAPAHPPPAASADSASSSSLSPGPTPLLPPPLVPHLTLHGSQPSPPPLPKREHREAKPQTPPSLPPKPDRMTSVESPSASRRSVADMAKLFSR